MIQSFTDEQTLRDLQIFDSPESTPSVIALFKHVKTHGARIKLDNLFRFPPLDLNIIKKRISFIQDIQKHKINFTIDCDTLDFIEYYLTKELPSTRESTINAIHRKINHLIKPNNTYYVTIRGISYIIGLLGDLSRFLNREDIKSLDSGLLMEYRTTVNDILELPSFQEIFNAQYREPNLFETGKFNILFCYSGKDRLRKILDIVYELDLYTTIGDVAAQLRFSYPLFLDSKHTHICIKGLYHPFLENPVKNDFDMRNIPITFITGANMGGKSTFLKALGISMYLSHLGLPVPASHMETIFFNQMFTTINMPDDIEKGYSHFYTEVLRTKKVAQSMTGDKKVFAIFDELFRGTNFTDAAECSTLLIEALTHISGGNTFILSTHILEIADRFANHEKIQQKCFRIKITDQNPLYDYILYDGISKDRIGSYIFKKEKIIDILENKKND